MNEVRPRFKDVEISGRNFRLRKFPAQTGGYVAIKVAGILAPMFDLIASNQGIEIGQVIAPMLSALSKLTEADFMDIQSKSLRICFELLQGGETQVLNQEGTFGVIGLDDDATICMALMVHALIFNLSSFFQGNPLTSLLGGLNMSLPGAQT
jgi:hypothetical protein